MGGPVPLVPLTPTSYREDTRSFSDVTMELITNYGHRVDRPLTDLDRLIARIRATPYRRLPDDDKTRLVALLAAEHQKREAIRFAPIP